jgi:hypothetical protein
MPHSISRQTLRFFGIYFVKIRNLLIFLFFISLYHVPIRLNANLRQSNLARMYVV